MKAILRNTSLTFQDGKFKGVVYLPSAMWQDAGWSLGDNVTLTLCKEYDDSGKFSHNSVSIEKIEVNNNGSN